MRDERLRRGRPWDEIVRGVRWHKQRAWGQIELFQRVYDCGGKKYWLICDDCGASKERVATCQKRVCRSCYGASIRQNRAIFHFARDRAVSRARAFGLMDPDRNDRWSEKLLTLTGPHRIEHGIARRIELFFDAWPLMRDSLKKHFAKLTGRNAHLVAWYRTFEWEIGNDSQGHPHFHFWWLSPYIEVDLIRHWWRCALRTAGYELSALEHVIVDIRQVKDAEGSAREVIKYVTKDILPDRKLISADLFARVYEAIDARRMSQPSSGLFKGTEGQATCSCGAAGCFRRSNTPPADHDGCDGDE